MWLVVLSILVLVASSELQCDVKTDYDCDGLSLLQVTKSLHKKAFGPANLQVQTQSGDCEQPHWSDLFTPIPIVLSKHPEMNGNCYFKFAADFLGDTAEYNPLSFLSIVLQFTPTHNGKEATIQSPIGGSLTTHLDNIWGSYPYDDGMCFAEGWLKGQNLDGLDFTNASAVYERSQQECEVIRQRNNWTGFEHEVTVGVMAADNDRIMKASECSAGQGPMGCTPVTLRDYDLHLYPKCLLGGEFTLSSQMVWCFARACLTEGNLIKHGMECYPDGLPNHGR